jgi:hypothetical protein
VKPFRSLAATAFLLAVAGVVLAGVRSSDGQHIVDPLGQSARATGHSIGGSLSAASLAALAGNGWAALAIGAALALAALLFVPATSSTVGRVVAVALATGVAVAVYHPQIIGGAA